MRSQKHIIPTKKNQPRDIQVKATTSKNVFFFSNAYPKNVQ